MEVLDGFIRNDELVSRILINLDITNLKNCRLVCQQWNRIVNDKLFWKHKAEEEDNSCIFKVPLNDKLIPWSFYASVYLHKPFGRNLIKNPCGIDRLEYWEVMSEGGDKFAVENPPQGSDNIPIEARLDCIESCFATSYHSCSKQQKITLAELGISAYIMDKYKPTISFTDWYAGRFDCGCVYECHFALLDRNRQEIVGFRERKQINQWEGREWHKLTHIFKDYPDGVRSILFYHGGMDRHFWAGHYGVKLTGSSVVINFNNM